MQKRERYAAAAYIRALVRAALALKVGRVQRAIWPKGALLALAP